MGYYVESTFLLEILRTYVVLCTFYKILRTTYIQYTRGQIHTYSKQIVIQGAYCIFPRIDKIPCFIETSMCVCWRLARPYTANRDRPLYRLNHSESVRELDWGILSSRAPT
jgi:hypothetical protein